MEPDKRLLAALMRTDATAARAAIANGANVNSVYSNTTLYGPKANDPEGIESALSVAIGNYDVETVEMLLQEGADPNWRAPGSSSDSFTGNIGGSRHIQNADGTWRTITGLQLAEIGLKHGLVATPDVLFRLEKWARNYRPGRGLDIRPFYERLHATATPEVHKKVAGLWKKHDAQARADEQKAIAQRAASEGLCSD